MKLQFSVILLYIFLPFFHIYISIIWISPKQQQEENTNIFLAHLEKLVTLILNNSFVFDTSSETEFNVQTQATAHSSVSNVLIGFLWCVECRKVIN